MLMVGIRDALNFPDKHARIPDKITAFYESLGQLLIWFFGKGFHLKRRMMIVTFEILDVTIACFRSVGSDADGNQPPGSLRSLDCRLNGLDKLTLLQDQMIRWSDHQGRLRVELAYLE